jgi:ABC-type antimicrobial peptide transport system permease subunit
MVVGVARDSHYSHPREVAPPHYYLPMGQQYTGRATLFIRGGGDPMSLAGPVRAALTGLDPLLPVLRLVTMERQLMESSWENNAMSTLVSAIAVLTLAMAMAGLYASLSQRVAARTREIGVRMALGEQRTRILRGALWNGMRLVAAGLVGGVALGLAANRTLKSFLYKVAPNDPATFALAAAVLVVAGVAACLAPAWRATRVDPVEALRWE